MLPIYHSSGTWRQPQHEQQSHAPVAAFGPPRLALTQGLAAESDAPLLQPMDLSMGDADSLAIADVPVGDRASQLAWRFAHMLAHRQRARGLILVDNNNGSDFSAAAAAAGTSSALVVSRHSSQPPERRVRRRQTARTKNCASVRRHPGTTKLSRLAKAHAASYRHLGSSDGSHSAEDERERLQLEVTIRELRDTIASLEQTQLLADSALLTWRTNRSGVAVDICRQYFLQFSRGYNPSDPALVVSSAMARAFMNSTMEPDVVARDFRGIEAFLGQWQTYTTYYDNFSSRMVSITVVDDEDAYVSLRAAAEMRFVFSVESLRALYPHLYQQMQTSAEAKAICEKLVGKECRLAFDVGMHFNQRGKVFVHESRVHLASALLDIIADPFAAMKVLNEALITEDGHWKTPERTEICEKGNELPKSLL